MTDFAQEWKSDNAPPVDYAAEWKSPSEDYRRVPDQGIASKDIPQPKESAFEKYVKAPAETAATVLSSIVAQPIGAAAGIVKGFTGGKYGTQQGAREAQQYAGEVADSLTYHPTTAAAQDYLGTLGSFTEPLAALGPVHGPTLQGFAAMPMATKAISAKPGAWTPAPEVSAANKAAFGSVGAQSAPLASRAIALAEQGSPETQAAVKNIVSKQGTVTPMQLATIERHVDADSLPVRMHLMSGQASGDPTLISNQFNAKGRFPEIPLRFKEQNGQLIENANAIREQAAPNIFNASPADLGDILIKAYEDKDAALTAHIGSLYQKLTDANGGKFPIDGIAFVDSAEAALKKQMKAPFVPAEVKQIMNGIKDENGAMTFEDFENLRTILASAGRTAERGGDGNKAAAISLVRDALENLPLDPNAAGTVKPIADAARAAAKQRFDLLRADPAYAAVVKGKASADRFVANYVTGADRDVVQTIRNNLADNPQALEALSYGAIEKLKDAAKIVNDGGVFNQAGYNKALFQLRDKLGVVVPPEQMRQLERLGRVAGYVKGQDAGTFFNNSNSWIAAMADAAKATAEGATNVAAHGIPLGTWTRQIAGHIKARGELKTVMEPAAGLRPAKLKDMAK